VALRRYQRRRGLFPDGIAGPKTYRSLAGRAVAPVSRHVVRPGESFFSIAARYHVSPWRLARRNRLSLMAVIVPNQRLALPRGARLTAPKAAGPPASRDAVRAAIDYWSRVYGVDPGLARALAWMESGWQQDVVSSVGALGVMQLLPETWDFVDVVLLGVRTPRTYQGNVRAGVRYLRWQLDEFSGDRHLALAGWYQGARAVRERGLYNETKVFVRIVLALYGTV
jgi:soluble lytic murein transglycosylase-like protein